MAGDDNADVLAYVPAALKSDMRELAKAAPDKLTVCDRTEDLIRICRAGSFPVVLLPAEMPTHDWLTVWGVVTSADPRPSILVYSLDSDFQMWSGLLEAGGHDVIVAPFDRAKLAEAIGSAAEDFKARVRSQ